MKAHRILVAITLLSAGCGASVEVMPLNAAPKPMQPRSAEQVEVFSGNQPDRSFVAVSQLEARQQSEFSTADRGEVMAMLRQKAGAIGCDGLIMGGSSDEVVGNTMDGEGYTATLKGYRATCIVYR